MKKIAAATLITIALIFYSCSPTISFDKPQPMNVKSLPTFPGHLRTNYLGTDDQDLVMSITDKLIIISEGYDSKMHKDSLDPSYKLIGDTILEQEFGKKEKVTLEGDFIIKHVSSIDTFFNISSDNVLKKFKGYYFLNNRYSNDSWEVYKLSDKKGVLTLGFLWKEDDIHKLKEITETIADTSNHFTLTKRQFKMFLKQGGFSSEYTFIRMEEKGR